MRKTLAALTAAAVVVSAAPARAGSLGVDLTGTWQGVAKCTFESNPDEKESVDVILELVETGGNFLAADLTVVGIPADPQALCGFSAPDEKKTAVSLSPIGTFTGELFGGPLPAQFQFQAKGDEVTRKMKGRAIVIPAMTKGNVGACKLKLQLTDGAAPTIGKHAGVCGGS